VRYLHRRLEDGYYPNMDIESSILGRSIIW
jgi:hypothetical protein